MYLLLSFSVLLFLNSVIHNTVHYLYWFHQQQSLLMSRAGTVSCFRKSGFSWVRVQSQLGKVCIHRLCPWWF